MKFRLIFLFLVITTIGFSQNDNILIRQDSTQNELPKAISIVDIIQQIESISKKIKDINKKIEPSPSIAKIDSLFPNYKKELNLKIANSESFMEANPNRQKINNLLNKWYSSKDYLKTLENNINDVIDRNSSILLKVSFDRSTWKLTLDSSVENNMPIEVKKRVESIVSELSEIENKIENTNNEYLILESKINTQLAEVNNLIQSLQEMKNSSVYNLFYLRHKPLWKTSFKSSNTQNKVTEEESIPNDLKGTLEFAKTFEHRIYLYFIIIFTLLLIFLYLKKGFNSTEINYTNNNLKNAKNIIHDKFILTSIFTSLIIAKIYFANAPLLFEDILTLSILITALPITHAYIYKKFQNIIYIVILFNVLETIKTYIWFESYQYRLYLLLEAFIVIISLYYFTKPYLQTRKLNLSKFSSLLIKLTPIVYFLALASVVSNILGYTNLTDVTLKICTQGSVLSLVFYAIMLVIKSVAFALMHKHYSNKSNYDVVKRIRIEKKIIKIIRVFVLIIWLLFFLQIIDQLETILTFFDEVLTEPHTIGTITFTLGAILSFITILIVSFLITGFISFIIDDGDSALKTFNLPKGIPAAISLVIRYLIIGFGIVFALSSLGIDLSKFNLMAGALGLGIGFGLQNVISNFVSGLILVFERPILTGDTVEVNNLMGTVKKIGVRSSKVSTFDGADVVVPNSNLISNDLINWTLSDNIKRVEILIGTSYDADPNKVLEILTECATNYAEALKEPAPIALFSDFGDSSLNFRLRFWVHFEIGLQAKSDVSIAIYNAFKEHGIEIPFPQQDIHVKDTPKSE